MNFKKLHIKHFRNFKDVEIELDNKNVLFGMNDVGKTNFLYAVRYLLDREVRQQKFVMSDFHKNDITQKIEITLELDLSDYETSEDTKKLVAQVKGARTSESSDIFYIKLESEFDEREVYGEAILKWGVDLENLIDIPARGTSYILDNVFKVVYINPLIDLDQLFHKNKKIIFDESHSDENDIGIIGEIKGITDQLNDKIGTMNIIKGFQEEITTEYKSLKNENISIEIKSEMSIKGFFSDVIPYIKKDGDDNYYPTSGDGRRKLLSYSILNYITKRKNSDKIIIFLIEEPENSLHRSMQIALSKQLFQQPTYNYFFLSTHSPELLYEMDNTRLIRVFSKDRVTCSSHMYKVDSNYKNVKRKLNKSLSAALFAERVLLIEGPSEKVLFEKILEETHPEYELDGGYLLEVDGISFSQYTETLNSLEIKTLIKTDNDLKAKRGSSSTYDLIGFNRCLKLLEKDSLAPIEITLADNISKKDKKRILNETKLEIYGKSKDIVMELEASNIYLSRIDLEHDLNIVIAEKMQSVLETTTPIDYLQTSKLYNMVELTNGLDAQDCEKIFNSDQFCCLKELVNHD
ncbi:ATP-dependent endonuclease [Priestia sp. TSO9]|uniref:ATP-dependent nuclease n=1 Tax=Priestia sp. TSO9 TaxID=2885632 RepID=UPI001E5E9A22|nr:AAA family ATPase [Priestia sp. TSO9]